MTGDNGKGEQQLVEDVVNFVSSSVVASVAAMIIAHYLLRSSEARRPPLWRRVALLPWKLYYTVAGAVDALRGKVVEWLCRKICCGVCDDYWCT